MANEKRLIDANALVTEIQSTASTVCLNAPWNAEWFSRLADRQEEIVAMIERQPKADAVEVVRCKKCKWSRTDSNDDADVYYCELRTGRAYHSGDFCSYGERRDNERKTV